MENRNPRRDRDIILAHLGNCERNFSDFCNVADALCAPERQCDAVKGFREREGFYLADVGTRVRGNQTPDRATYLILASDSGSPLSGREMREGAVFRMISGDLGAAHHHYYYTLRSLVATLKEIGNKYPYYCSCGLEYATVRELNNHRATCAHDYLASVKRDNDTKAQYALFRSKVYRDLKALSDRVEALEATNN